MRTRPKSALRGRVLQPAGGSGPEEEWGGIRRRDLWRGGQPGGACLGWLGKLLKLGSERRSQRLPGQAFRGAFPPFGSSGA